MPGPQAKRAERREPRRQDVDHGAVRPARRLAHRAPAGLDAGVLRLRPSLRGLAVSLQGPRPGESDPFLAGVQAVLGAARNVACAGGEPIGLTDCLNFGNPEKPEIAYELARRHRGDRAGRRGARDPGRVGERVALQRHRRAFDPTHAGRGLRRPRAGRAARAGRMATRRRGAARAGARGEPRRRGGLVRFLWKAAPILSLCHDVGYAGLEHSLAEAARWSGHEAESELPEEPARGAAILATSPTRLRALARAASSRSDGSARCAASSACMLRNATSRG